MIKKWWVIVLIVAIIAGLLTGGFFYYKKKIVRKPEPAKAEVGKLNPINPVFDMMKGKTLNVTVKDGGKIAVFDAEKVGMTLIVPPGAVDKDVKLKLVPIKKRDSAEMAGLTILPDNITFKKPVELAFDFSYSAVKNSTATSKPYELAQKYSKSHIYRYNTVSTNLIPLLVNRSSENTTYLPGQIYGGGIYSYVLNDQLEVDRANYVLSLSGMTVSTILESANTLYSNGKTLDDKKLNEVKGIIAERKADKEPNVVVLNAALTLSAKLNKKSSLVERALADAVYGGYLDARCKDPSTSPEELLSVWKTAQLAGEETAADNCKTRLQNVVADRVNKLLDQPDPTYIDLLKAHQDVILVGLEDKFKAAIEKKQHDKAVREAQELLKDPSVDARILTIAWQNVCVFAQEETELQQALQNRINQRLATDVQRVLSDPNATKQDIQRAIAQNDFAGGDPETKKKLEEKLKDAKEGPDAKVDETSQETVEEEIPAFDWAIVGVAFLKMMGLEDFSEAGIKAFADQKAQEAEAMRAYVMEMCTFTEALSGQNMQCEQKDQEIENAIEQFKNDMGSEAEKIGAIQAIPEETPDSNYDGTNDESITVSCISREEADQIDPERKLGYTICPEEATNNENVNSEDNSSSEDDNSSNTDSAESNQNENNNSESDAITPSEDPGEE